MREQKSVTRNPADKATTAQESALPAELAALFTGEPVR